jgi:hypothetical protein
MGLSEKDSHERTVRTGPPGQDSQGCTTRKGKPGKDNKAWSIRKDSQDGNAGTARSGQDCTHRTGPRTSICKSMTKYNEPTFRRYFSTEAGFSGFRFIFLFIKFGTDILGYIQRNGSSRSLFQCGLIVTGDNRAAGEEQIILLYMV